MAEYIKREAIMEFPIRKDRCDKERANEHFIFGIESVLEYVENLPAADVAPVVHGRWDGNDCTVCKLPWNYNMVQDADDWGYFDPMPDYCPNCVAKMDGGGGDAAD